jgi:hypothetical protein
MCPISDYRKDEKEHSPINTSFQPLIGCNMPGREIGGSD